MYKTPLSTDTVLLGSAQFKFDKVQLLTTLPSTEDYMGRRRHEAAMKEKQEPLSNVSDHGTLVSTENHSKNSATGCIP